MAKKSKHLVTSFSSDGHYLAILSPDCTSVKIWSAKDQTLLTEWKPSPCDEAISYTCLALSVSMKKRRKKSTCLLAIGSSDGKILAVDALTGETKWTCNRGHLSGLIGLCFVDGANSLYAVSSEGIIVHMNSENGESIRDFKATESPISSVAFSYDRRVIALYDGELRLVSLQSEQELLKFSADMGPLYDILISDDVKTIVTSGKKNKYLLVWRCDASCTLGKPKKIKVNAKSAGVSIESRESAEKNFSSIITAKLDPEEGNLVAVVTAHGSTDSPPFSLVHVGDIGDDIVMTTAYGVANIQAAGVPLDEALTKDVRSKKKRAASDPDIAAEDVVGIGQKESFDGGLVEDDLNEPTMGQKLEKLNLLNGEEKMHGEKQGPSPLAEPPSADSVNVLLRQALHADDRALLLDCLYTQDEKVIANSISLLNPPDVHKLLQYLISVVQLRGAVVACALPWLRWLLLQHASGIIAQESSFTALNSLYQLIESRVSTFQSALQLSSCLNLLYAGVIEEGEDDEIVKPVIYEDKDESEEEQSSDGDAMETDQDSEVEELTGVLSDGFGDVEIDGMSE